MIGSPFNRLDRELHGPTGYAFGRLGELHGEAAEHRRQGGGSLVGQLQQGEGLIGQRHVEVSGTWPPGGR